MEPPRSPETSPIKSSCPSSPAQSPITSPIVSAESSPIRSLPSSPIRSNPSSPHGGVNALLTSPCSEVSQQSDLFQLTKRQKLDSVETNQLEITGSRIFFHQENEDHCRQLFTESFDDCSASTTLSAKQGRTAEQLGHETNQATGADNFSELQYVASDASQHHTLTQETAAEGIQFEASIAQNFIQDRTAEDMQLGEETNQATGAESFSKQQYVASDTSQNQTLRQETAAGIQFGDENEMSAMNQNHSGAINSSDSQVITDKADNDGEQHISRERKSSSSSSSASSSSCSSSDGSFVSTASSDGPESSNEEDSEHSDSDKSSEQDENASSDESDSEYFSPKIYDGCELSEDEGVLLLMDLFTKYKLSKKQVGGILKGILKFIPSWSTFPKTQYSLFEYVKKLSPVSHEKVHYYCSVCHFYLGAMEMNCTLCGNASNKFFQLPLADQIRNLFENHGLADVMDKYAAERSNLENGGYSDLMDGTEFKRAHVPGQYNLDLMGHTDGISVSISSNVSLWPWEWVIAQLPPHLRYKYVLVNAIWLDETKPYMNTFMKPMVEELKTLREQGVTWTHPRTKAVHTTHITTPCLCADAPARAQIQNILSHGGINCCHSCEQKMKKLPAEPVVLGEKRKPRRRVFTFKENVVLRTSVRMDNQGKKARTIQQATGTKLKPVKGVKGPSDLSSLPGCDRSTAVFPEYMHLMLCLLKEFMTLWFEKDGPWSLKEHRDKINEFLKKIRVPDFITRIPRSTEHFSKWKANEFRSFLLFFSLIILSKCMKVEYFQHWMLLVNAVYLLLQDYVSESDVSKANLFLRLFCRSFAALYKHDFYTYYVHQLTHLALTVQRHGPLHCNSAFMLESFNGTLSKYIHGTKNQGKELVNNIRIAFGVEALRARTLYCSAASNESVQFRNPIRDIYFSEADLKMFHFLKKPLNAFHRAIIKRETFTCSLYTRQKKRNNFTVCFRSISGTKSYGEIKYFCQSEDKQQVALINKFAVDHQNSFFHEASGVVIKHIIPVLPTEVTEVVQLDAILCKVIRVENYVCLRPNKIEYNL